MTEDKKYTLAESLFIIAGSVVVFPFLILLSLLFSLLLAYTRLRLYAWFAVPFLHAPPLTFWQVYGITILIRTFTSYKAHAKDAPKPTWKEEFTALFINVSGWLIAFAMGAAVHTWLARP